MNRSTDLVELLSDLPPTVSPSRLAAALGISAHVVMGMVARGALPQPARLNQRVLLFRTEDVREALSRLAAKAEEV